MRPAPALQHNDGGGSRSDSTHLVTHPAVATLPSACIDKGAAPSTCRRECSLQYVTTQRWHQLQDHPEQHCG